MVMVILDSPLGCLVSLLLKLHQSEAVPHTVHSRLGGGLQKEDILGREEGKERIEMIQVNSRHNKFKIPSQRDPIQSDDHLSKNE